ncbi:MAG: hypothetical protein ACUVUS_06730, partial [Thermoproteota archaeon]
ALNFDYQGMSIIGFQGQAIWEPLILRYMKGIIWKQLAPFLGSYTYVAFIYAALTATIAGDLSSGYMALILSKPFKRSEVFMVRTQLTFLMPLAIFLLANSASILIIGGLDCLLADPWYTLICYGTPIISFLYVFSVCLALTLIAKEVVPSFISSLLFLYGADYAARALSNNSIMPNTAFTGFWFALGSETRAGAGLPWLSILMPLAISISLVAACFLYFTRRLEV